MAISRMDIKLLILSVQHFNSERYSVYCNVRKRNLYIHEAENSYIFAFLLKNTLTRLIKMIAD